ncbi:MAG: hypothetical protein LBV71_09480 [Prevotella sp.]|nr:hypothetical protein [Prevotella sp.]
MTEYINFAISIKKFAQTLILLIAAVTVFLTGAGVTIVNYCCTSCSGQTLFMTEQHICCAQGQHETESESCCSSKEASHDTCEGESYTKDTHCTASRLSIDIDAASFRPHVAIPFVWISDASQALPTTILPEIVEYNDGYTLFKSPPEAHPREYLSLIRVLII